MRVLGSIALFVVNILSTFAFTTYVETLRLSRRVTQPPVSRSHPTLSQVQMARKPFISGNWKLNPKTKNEAIQLAADIAASITRKSPKSDVALFVPYVFIESARKAANGKLMIGAQVSRFPSATCFIFRQYSLSMFVIYPILARVLCRFWCLHRCSFHIPAKIRWCTVGSLRSLGATHYLSRIRRRH